MKSSFPFVQCVSYSSARILINFGINMAHSVTPEPPVVSNPMYVPSSGPEACNLKPVWQKPSHCHRWGSTEVSKVTFAGGHGKHPYPAISKTGHLSEYVLDVPRRVIKEIGDAVQGNVLIINVSEWTPEAAVFMWHLPQNRLLLIELLTYAYRSLNRLEDVIKTKNVSIAEQNKLIPPAYKECFQYLFRLYAVPFSKRGDDPKVNVGESDAKFVASKNKAWSMSWTHPSDWSWVHALSSFVWFTNFIEVPEGGSSVQKAFDKGQRLRRLFWIVCLEQQKTLHKFFNNTPGTGHLCHCCYLVKTSDEASWGNHLAKSDVDYAGPQTHGKGNKCSHCKQFEPDPLGKKGLGPFNLFHFDPFHFDKLNRQRNDEKNRKKNDRSRNDKLQADVPEEEHLPDDVPIPDDAIVDSDNDDFKFGRAHWDLPSKSGAIVYLPRMANAGDCFLSEDAILKLKDAPTSVFLPTRNVLDNMFMPPKTSFPEWEKDFCNWFRTQGCIFDEASLQKFRADLQTEAPMPFVAFSRPWEVTFTGSSGFPLDPVVATGFLRFGNVQKTWGTGCLKIPVQGDSESTTVIVTYVGAVTSADDDQEDGVLHCIPHGAGTLMAYEGPGLHRVLCDGRWKNGKFFSANPLSTLTEAVVIDKRQDLRSQSSPDKRPSISKSPETRDLHWFATRYFGNMHKFVRLNSDSTWEARCLTSQSLATLRERLEKESPMLRSVAGSSFEESEFEGLDTGGVFMNWDYAAIGKIYREVPVVKGKARLNAWDAFSANAGVPRATIDHVMHIAESFPNSETGSSDWINFNAGMHYGRSLESWFHDSEPESGVYMTSGYNSVFSEEFLVSRDRAQGADFIAKFCKPENCTHLAYNACASVKNGSRWLGKFSSPLVQFKHWNGSIWTVNEALAVDLAGRGLDHMLRNKGTFFCLSWFCDDSLYNDAPYPSSLKRLFNLGTKPVTAVFPKRLQEVAKDESLTFQARSLKAACNEANFCVHMVQAIKEDKEYAGSLSFLKKKFIRGNYKPLKESRLSNCSRIMAVPGEMNDIRVLLNTVGANYDETQKEFSRLVHRELKALMPKGSNERAFNSKFNETQKKIPSFFKNLVDLAQREDIGALNDGGFCSTMDKKIVMNCYEKASEMTVSRVESRMKKDIQLTALSHASGFMVYEGLLNKVSAKKVKNDQWLSLPYYIVRSAMEPSMLDFVRKDWGVPHRYNKVGAPNTKIQEYDNALTNGAATEGPKYCVSKCLEFVIPKGDVQFQHALRGWAPKETDRVGKLLGELTDLRGHSAIEGVRGYAVYNEKTLAKQLSIKPQVLKEDFLKPDSSVQRYFSEKIGEKGAPIGFVMTVNTRSGYDGHCFAVKFLRREAEIAEGLSPSNAVVYSPDEGVEDLAPLVHGITKIQNIWGVWVVENVPVTSLKRVRRTEKYAVAKGPKAWATKKRRLMESDARKNKM